LLGESAKDEKQPVPTLDRIPHVGKKVTIGRKDARSEKNPAPAYQKKNIFLKRGAKPKIVAAVGGSPNQAVAGPIMAVTMEDSGREIRKGNSEMGKG